MLLRGLSDSGFVVPAAGVGLSISPVQCLWTSSFRKKLCPVFSGPHVMPKACLLMAKTPAIQQEISLPPWPLCARSTTLCRRCGPIAQRLEQRTHNPLVPGSNPGGPTMEINALRCLFWNA